MAGATRRIYKKFGTLSYISFSLPVYLIACALTGGLGYTNLAWVLLSYLGWFLIVATIGLYAFGVLSDVVAVYRDRIRTRSRDPELIIKNVLRPLAMIAKVVLVLVSLYSLMVLYGWDSETFGIRHLLAFMQFSLVTIDTGAVTVADVMTAILVLIMAVKLSGWAHDMGGAVFFSKIDNVGIREALASFLQYAVVIGGVLLAMTIAGINLGVLTIFAATLGVGIGFGMQNVVNNFISGILLLVERPLKINDLVTVDGHLGFVTRIGIRSLTLRQFNKYEVIIPNSAVIAKEFVNRTHTDDIVRDEMMIGISYADDPFQAIEIIERIANNCPSVIDDPAPECLLWDFGDSAVLLRFKWYMRKFSSNSDTTRDYLMKNIWTSFNEFGITIPYPQRDVHVQVQGRKESTNPLFMGAFPNE